MRELSMKQEKFCLEYVRCGNATEAARRAGYKGSDTTLAALASGNLRKPKLMDYIDELKTKIANEAIADATERKEFLTKVLRGELTEVTITSDGSKITVPAKLQDRIRASDQLNKMDSTYIQKLDVEGGLQVVISDDYA